MVHSVLKKLEKTVFLTLFSEAIIHALFRCLQDTVSRAWAKSSVGLPARISFLIISKASEDFKFFGNAEVV